MNYIQRGVRCYCVEVSFSWLKRELHVCSRIMLVASHRDIEYVLNVTEKQDGKTKVVQYEPQMQPSVQAIFQYVRVRSL